MRVGLRFSRPGHQTLRSCSNCRCSKRGQTDSSPQKKKKRFDCTAMLQQSVQSHAACSRGHHGLQRLSTVPLASSSLGDCSSRCRSYSLSQLAGTAQERCSSLPTSQRGGKQQATRVVKASSSAAAVAAPLLNGSAIAQPVFAQQAAVLLGWVCVVGE